MILLIILLTILVLATAVIFVVKMKNRSLIRGWTFTSEPIDQGFWSSTILDPDGTQWGYEKQSGRVKKPFPVDELPRNYSSYRTNNKTWTVDKPHDTKTYVLSCAREDRKRKALAAREVVERSF